MKFPADNEVITCPHCVGTCAFTIFGGIETPGKSKPKGRIVVARCISCYGFVLGLFDTLGNQKEFLYPIKAARPQCPADIALEDPGLARHYNDAVACEPHSLTAAMFLLGRCAERILVSKFGADPKKTLGTMELPVTSFDDLERQYFSEAFVVSRNQAGHFWKGWRWKRIARRH
jgi:hypothetical protein